MKKELKNILKKVNKLYSILENTPDIGDTSLIDTKEIKKVNSTINKVMDRIDELSGDIAELIEAQ